MIAIIGRTNVGKSALFNRLVGQRRAIVEDYAGVTRDRLYAEIDLEGHRAILVDTGGLVGADSDELIGQVREQAARALAEADVLILLFDGQEGLVAHDYEVADAARRSGKPVVAAVNKLEGARGETAPFTELGFGTPLAISALHNQGLHALEQALIAVLPAGEADLLPPNALGLAILGRPNAGKSAVTNALLGTPRMIVSEVPGTTRDVVDTVLEWQGKSFVLVDTPGLRRRAKRTTGLEYYSSLRTLRALQRAEIGVVVFDAAEGLTQQDAAIALEVHRAGRPLILLANKWDLVRETAFADSELPPDRLPAAEKLLLKDFERLARSRLKFAVNCPLLFTCALTGEGVTELLPLAATLTRQYHTRIETGPLNRALHDALAKHAPPAPGGRQAHLKYITQVETAPPTFVLFVNDPKLVHFSYQRYLMNFLRERFDLGTVPINFKVRAGAEKEGG
jgi:GTP-binding protein